MSIIIPAILTNSVDDFTKKLQLLDTFPGVTDIQIDFVDNRFAPNLTIMPTALPSLPLKYIFSAHLMVQKPMDYIADVEKAGFEAAVLHFESFNGPDEFLKAAAAFADAGLAPQMGVAIDTPINHIEALLPELDTIVLMGVELGFQGNQFLEKTFERIQFLRQKDFYGTIVIDGGINKEKVSLLLTGGADSLVVGSSIFKSDDPKQSFIELSKQAGEIQK